MAAPVWVRAERDRDPVAHVPDPTVDNNDSYARALCGRDLLRPRPITGDARSQVRCPSCVRRAPAAARATSA